MGQFVTESPISLPNNSALSRFRRMVMSGGYVAYALASQKAIGILGKACQTTDAQVAVATMNTDGTVCMVANGAISQYAKVYAADSGKVSSAGGVIEGIALQAASVDGDEIQVLPWPADAGGRFFVQTVPSSNVTSTVTETAFDQSVTLPADALKAGDKLRISGLVTAPTTNSTDTLTVKVKIGSTVLVASAATDVADNDVCVWSIDLVVRTDGATGTFVASGFLAIGASGTGAAKAFVKQSTTIDTTATQAITVTATWSVASASDICRLDQLEVARSAA